MSKHFTPKNWEDNVTLEQIEEMEKQGCDVAELRKKFEDKVAAKEAHERKLIEDSLNILDFNKLASNFATPRDVDGEFMKDVVAYTKAKPKRIEQLAGASVIYGAVVQAHYSLYEPGNNDMAAMVIVFATDEKHIHDIEWLNATARKISEMKESGDVPRDCVKFITTLRDDRSMFCFKLGESLSGYADAWCATHTISKPGDLPLGYLPANGIVPFLLVGEPEENQFPDIELIPSRQYTK
ncbi:hypothetical protein D0T53_12565 [Dysgonomonas sp. 216]|nr:hypothetical protein [Dysgonomonas sp. 216]